MPATRKLPPGEFSSSLETYRQTSPQEILFTISFFNAGIYYSNTPATPENALHAYQDLRANDVRKLKITDAGGIELTEQQLSMIVMVRRFIKEAR
ncbi:hypothetical protein [Methylorubrum sp. SB2]|uniref:hypothetical protein n=1 Tax=Methylorubrum subtropicum TaxID=3138812 RepID=UPI00313EBEF1